MTLDPNSTFLTSCTFIRPQREIMVTWLASELNDRRRQIMRPKNGSLYRIMRDNVGMPFYLRPIYWVDIYT